MLAVAVLLINLVSGSICAADTPARFTTTTAVTTPMTSPAGAAVSTLSVEEEDPATCLLGEKAGCHCACAHSVTLPATALLSIARIQGRSAPFGIRSGFTPATSGSLLRPPIA